MPRKYDRKKAKMFRHKKLCDQGLLPSPFRTVHEIIKKNDPKSEGSLNIRKLYAGKGERKTAMANEDINDFLK